ncbi:MAG TPA: hypothetical protein V6C91_13550 [Coleofasciculaceae cyanobacterium]
MLGLGKRAIGIFPNRQNAESAINTLRMSNFPMDKVSLVAKDANQDDAITSSQSKFIRNGTIKGLAWGILGVATLGSIAGGLLASLTALGVPGADSIAQVGGANAVLVGALAGAFYGAGAGGIIGGFIGNGVSRERAKAYKSYSDRLSDGAYLVIISGTNDEIQQAESLLRNQGVQDWGVFSAT